MFGACVLLIDQMLLKHEFNEINIDFWYLV